MRIRSRLKKVEKAMKKDKLELQLVSGDSILLDNSDLLALFNESFYYMPVVNSKGETYYPAADEFSENMKAVDLSVSGQDKFIDSVKNTINSYRRQQNENN